MWETFFFDGYGGQRQVKTMDHLPERFLEPQLSHSFTESFLTASLSTSNENLGINWFHHFESSKTPSATIRNFSRLRPAFTKAKLLLNVAGLWKFWEMDFQRFTDIERSS